MMEVKWSHDREIRSETLVIWDGYEIEWRINPGRKPTEQEQLSCPKVFTCFACLARFPQRELGGSYHEKWFCGYCIPFVDEWTAGAMVWWEEKRHQRVIWSRPKSKKPLTRAERAEQIRNAVCWCIAHGYPIKPKEKEGGRGND
jgi:hypothetical protein